MLTGRACFLLLSLTVTSCQREPAGSPTINKCCAAGEIISTVENFTCIPHEISTEIHTKTESNRMHLDECPENGNVSITKLSDITDKKMGSISASSGCIDLLHDEEKLGVVPIVVHCQTNDTDGKSLEIPSFTRFRVCCRRGHVYDVAARDCVPNQLGSTDTVDYLLTIIRDSYVIEPFPEFMSFVRGPPQCKHAIVDYVIDTRDLQVLPNGTLQILIPSDGDRSVLLTQENSCLDVATPSELITVRLCSGPQYCQKNACVRKCCPEGQARIGKECQTIPPSMLPGEFHRQLQNFSQATVNITTAWRPLDTANYGLIVGNQSCKSGMYPLLPDENPIIDSRGYIHIHVPSHQKFRHHEYCMEILHDVFGYENGLYPAVCFTTEIPTERNQWRFGINAAMELTSCMFLLITFLVYVFLPLLQNLHGKTLMCHVASLFVAYACLAAIALMKPPDPVPDPLYHDTDDDNETSSRYACKFVGYTMLFSFLAAFSWLNVMCFDIWWTFGGLGGAAMGGRRQAQRKRFFLYSLYAWGFAFILACLAVSADYTNFIEKHLRPNIGVDSCWFEQSTENYGELIFFTGPISLQLMVNVIFFISTSLHCSRVKAEITRVMRPTADPKSRRFHSDRSKFIVNIKLFIVMGISWIMEVISFFLNNYATNFNWRAEFFYVSDAINCLQGLLIFILFVLKSKVYHALKHRLSNRKTNVPGSNLTTTLQDPYRVRKSASCSTLMSTYAVNTVP